MAQASSSIRMPGRLPRCSHRVGPSRARPAGAFPAGSSFHVLKDSDGTVTVALSNGAIYTLENCSDELYNKIIGCRFDFDKLEDLLNPKLSKNKKELDDYYKFIEDVKKSNLITKEGDCFYIKSISEISVPEQLVKAIIKEELEDENSEVINSYLNFWRLCSMNPNSETRTNLF